MIDRRALGLLLGAGLDVLFADPARSHPVAGFGRVAGSLEQVVHRDNRLVGAAYAAVLVGVPALAAHRVERALAARPASPAAGLAMTALTAATTWAVLGGTSLRREGRALGGELARADLAAARRRLPSLCGRDPSVLDAAGLARAGVESLAENTSDAVVAPLLWGAAAGLPGLVAYRAVNTLDAMVGYRNARHRRFGWAAARADDLANLVPARICALLTCACAPVVGGSPAQALRTVRRDGRRHPSPNSGMAEAAFAGAAGLRLGGELRYAHGVEHRPELGAGRRPQVEDLAVAARLSGAVTVAAAGLSAGVAAAAARSRSRSRAAAGKQA
ncbi:cobalamin biosynthesis protein [Parafrankia sp. EUN1f]|uniref:cobalamin biosynthesis protein n=1 Tax=Parafrankia sp. EUN1f TaxID=102897 RepID=UPI0001C44A0B|nr:cobalamin biosynthesis protein [Parafrankia sp. EUN1f]EFC85274.1 cobalamin biosynthesis protein CobD [Parafrankia sp. EUN1f]